MALSDYNGFPGKYREAVGRRMERTWKANPELRPSECAVCFQTAGAIHGHNEDYSVEDVYLPICITCHLLLHMRWSMPALWEDYKLAVRHGFQGPPLNQNNGMRVLKTIYPGELYNDDRYIYEERSATVLDMLCAIKYEHPKADQCKIEPNIPNNVTPIRGGTPFDVS